MMTPPRMSIVSRTVDIPPPRRGRRELAEELGVSRQTVNALEAGRYDPSLPLAFTIARVFGLTIEEIFFPDDEAS